MQKQNGNILFLILIAVALFAALSYAVTKSTSGGGSADAEKNALSASEYLNYGSGLKFGVMRMQVNGIADSNMVFGGGYLDSFPCLTGSGTNCAYANEGGGAGSQLTPAGNRWYHYANNTTGVINGVGTASNDFYIYTGISDAGLCAAINRGLGITSDPVVASTGGGSTNINAYPGEPAACYEDYPGADDYAFYYVVLER